MLRSALYPLKFEPIYKHLLWGGSKIFTFKGEPASYGDVGESWELSGVKDNVSKVSNGPLKDKLLTDLLEQYRELFVGEQVYSRYGNEFPLLFKLIDAHDDLSIQVHPNDEMARKRHQSNGKTEMWYVLDSEQDAYLYAGFNKDTTRHEVKHCIESDNILSILNKEKVEPDHAFFVPAGRIHSIGKGVLLAEVQQTSDVTYRVWDYGRRDSKGNKRQLHVDLALDAMDYRNHNSYRTVYRPKLNSKVKLKECSYFTESLIEADTVMNFDYGALDSFVVWMCIGGQAVFASQRHHKDYISQGETVLFPACDKPVAFIPSCGNVKILEVYIA